MGPLAPPTLPDLATLSPQARSFNALLGLLYIFLELANPQ